MNSLDASIRRALRFLHQSQLPIGEFRVLRSRDQTMASDCVEDSSPFGSAMIAYSLRFARELRSSGDGGPRRVGAKAARCSICFESVNP